MIHLLHLFFSSCCTEKICSLRSVRVCAGIKRLCRVTAVHTHTLLRKTSSASICAQPPLSLIIQWATTYLLFLCKHCTNNCRVFCCFDKLTIHECIMTRVQSFLILLVIVTFVAAQDDFWERRTVKRRPQPPPQTSNLHTSDHRTVRSISAVKMVSWA